MTTYLTLEEALRVVVAEEIGPVLDAGLLDSALARPRSSAFGEDAYPTLKLKGPALLQSVANNHALMDGNKRLSWLATVMFLDLNGAEPALTQDEAYDLVMDVATSAITDLKVIADRLTLRPARSDPYGADPLAGVEHFLDGPLGAPDGVAGFE